MKLFLFIAAIVAVALVVALVAAIVLHPSRREFRGLRSRLRFITGNLAVETGALSFIPEVWSATILESLKKASVYAGPTVVNRDYEGDIKKQGDTVRIRSI